MPWERKTVYEQREEFARAAMECSNFSALCREFGITRRTGYKWVARYKAGMPIIEAFQEFGLPDSILSDNGAQFAGFKKGYTQFEKWLMDLDILPIHGRIKHPQTQGKIERFHRTLKSELLKRRSIADIDDAERQFQCWRERYNHVRPHEALGMRCPGEVYSPSSRKYPEKISKYEYGGQYHVIKVNSWGYVRFDRWQIYLSETMVGQNIEFRPSPDGETFAACYRNYKIAEFDTSTGQLIHRKIVRL